MSGLTPWRGRFDDPAIKKVNFLQGNQTLVNDGRDYFGEFEELNEKKTFSSSSSSQGQHTRVVVRVIEARDLLSSNATGLSDPFAVIVLNNVKFQTEIQRRTLDPVWKWEHTFDIDMKVFNELEITVWDFSAPQQTFLGALYLDLGKMDENNLLSPPSLSTTSITTTTTTTTTTNTTTTTTTINRTTTTNTKLMTNAADSMTEPHWYELQRRKWNEHVGGEILLQLTRFGKRINSVVTPVRQRKADIFDLELSENEAQLLLSPVELTRYSKIKAMYRTGIELFEQAKKQVADFDERPRPRKKSRSKRAPPGGASASPASAAGGGAAPPAKAKKATPLRHDEGVLTLDLLPEEVLFRIFVFLNAVERAQVSSVCSVWYRILRDPGLKTPILEVLEILDKEYNETDQVQRQAYSVSASIKIKPIVLCLYQFSEWQKETEKCLIPFPIEQKTEQTIYESKAMIDALAELTRLAWRIDNWKNKFRGYRVFQQSFKHFQEGWSYIPNLPSEESNMIRKINFNDSNLFLESQSLKNIFESANCLMNNATISQTCFIANGVLSQITRQRYISISELETLIEMLAVSLLWVIIGGQADNVKRHKFKIDKAIKVIRENEDRVPPWLFDALSNTSFAKTNKKLHSMLKDFL